MIILHPKDIPSDLRAYFEPVQMGPVSVLTPRPESYSRAHYAVFPTSLIAPLIRATVPTRCCPECGAGWAAVVERTEEPAASHKGSFFDRGKTGITGLGRVQQGERYETNVHSYRPTCECGYPGLEPGDLEFIASPTGTRTAADPSLETGRAGYNRPRGPDEGQRFITRYEQRRYAEQIKQSPYRDQMEADIASATTFAHYIRTDRSGARPVPQPFLDRWIENGWLERIAVPAGRPLDPLPGWLLDPFVGSGTALAVARELGLNAVGIDLSAEYLDDHARVRAKLGTPAGALGELPLFELLEEPDHA